jgi:hypothetical protein
MAVDSEKLRHAVEGLLKEDKGLNERDVKAAVAKALKVKPGEIGAGVIREVRRKMGIDRPAALAWARALLAKAPTTEARVVIEGIFEKFGIRVGPPDVTRLRPKEARRPRKNGRRKGTRAEGRPKVLKPEVVDEAPKKGRGKASRAPEPVVVPGPVKGEVSVTFQGRGTPEELARFFLSLSKTR